MADATSAVEKDEVRRIVDAGWDMLDRAGYENLKMQVVARLAGVSVGTLYRHFGGKQELTLALLRAELERATAVLERLMATGTPTERVCIWVDAVVSLRFGRRAGPRAQWITTLPPDIRTVAFDTRSPESDTARPLRQAIEDGVLDGSFPAADPQGDGTLILALCSRLVESPVPMFSDREETVGLVADFVLAALTNPERRHVLL